MILETIYKCRVMKIINTLSVLFFLLVAVACSSEGDTIMNDIDKEVEASSEAFAIFNVALANDGVLTKASIDNPNMEDGGNRDPEENNNAGSEWSLDNCFIAVFKVSGNTKEFVTSHLFTNNDLRPGTADFSYDLSQQISVKVPASNIPELLFVAVAQTNNPVGNYPEDMFTRTDLLKCTDYDELQKIVIREQPNVLVKYGEQPLKAYKTSDKVIHDHPLETCNSVNIPLKQRTAAIQLESFSVYNAQGKKLESTITSVGLENMKWYTTVGSELKSMPGELSETYGEELYYEDIYGSVSLKSVGKNNDLSGEWMKYACYYTYENTNSNRPTTFIINYTVTNDDGTSENGQSKIIIRSLDKTPEVIAGNFYQLKVTVKNAVATATISCSTNDWEEGGVIEVPVQK